jgi:acetyl-CoA carboxylase biotin carboxyl carrier protein
LAQSSLNYDDILQFVEMMKTSDAFSEFHLRIGDIELDVRKSGAGVSGAAPAAAPVAPAPQDAAASVPAAPAQKRGQNEFPEGSVLIKSPMVGTFYRSPEPGAAPYVKVGQGISPDSIVCIIEVMKLMNSIPAGCRGTVTQILVEDAQPVDSGQVLIVIDPKE